MALLDICRIVLTVLVGMIFSPKRLPLRSWGSEYICRIAKRLGRESIGKPITWLRTRQELLKFSSPDLLKVKKEFKYVAGVGCVSYTPKHVDDSGTLIIYLHGGGYVTGSISVYATTMVRIALATKSKVIGPEYRLAPEHALPAAQDDCLAVTLAILNNIENRDKKVILMGDSAGGGLCLSTLRSLNTAKNIKTIDACVLMSPWLAATDAAADHAWFAHKNEKSDFLDRDILTYLIGMSYKDKKTQEHHLDLMDMDISLLPPLYIQAGSAEVFIKQISAFTARLKQAKADYQYDVFEHQFHVFQSFAPFVKEEVEAMNRIGEFVAGVRSASVFDGKLQSQAK